MTGDANIRMRAAIADREARLDCPIEWIVTSQRAVRACHAAGAMTVRDFLRCKRTKLLAVKGCGRRTLADIEAAVAGFLDAVEQDSNHGQMAPLLLNAVVKDPRALHAFRELDITTVQQFLDTPRDALLATPGFGMRTYQRVLDRVRSVSQPRRTTTGLLPPGLLHLPIAELDLADQQHKVLADLGVTTVGDLLANDALVRNSLGPDSCERLRDALGQLLHRGLASCTNAQTRSFARLSAHLLSFLSLDHQALVRRRLGIGSRACSIAKLAAQRDTTPAHVESTLTEIQRELSAHAGTLLDPVRDEGRQLLDSQEGIATPDCLVSGGLLHAAAQESEDSMVPFRLLALCYPGEFFVCGTALTRTPPHRVAAIRKLLPRLTRAAHLPKSVPDLEARLADRGHTIDRGLLLHLLLSSGLTVTGEGDAGEMLVHRPDPVTARVAEILAESPQPMTVEDLVFHYRDRHRSCHTGRLLEHLRADTRLIEVGPDTWSLRERHETELAQLAAKASTLANTIHERGGRHGVAGLLADDEKDVRTIHLITSCLRQDPSLRDLGRGEFCSAHQPMSALMQEIHTALSRAMGELPVARFLDNLSAERRRAAARLLRENRMFVEPSPDRVDLLTNYPFNPDRLHELKTHVEEFVGERGGYGTLEAVLEMIQETGLRGDYLTEHLLGDLLRRHGGFEVLPGGFVAEANLGLGGWIQQRAREALRQANLPLTPDEILNEVPELSEFTEGLEQLLARDPLVLQADALHYSVV